jgi:hypothetical protein
VETHIHATNTITQFLEATKTIMTALNTYLSVILPEIQPIEDVGMPGFQVHSKRALPLATTLIYIAGCVIEDTKHGNDAIRGSISASNVTARGPNVVNRQTNSTSRLADNCTLFQSIVDALYTILLHAYQEAAAELHTSITHPA